MADNYSEFALETIDGDHFDLAYTISQFALNRNLEDRFGRLRQKHPSAAKIFFNTENDGCLDLQLGAPLVFIGSEATAPTTISYMLVIDSGYAMLKSGDKLQLNGSKFVVNCPVAQNMIKPEAAGNMLIDFKIPRHCRLYNISCVLAEAQWKSPDGIRSTIFINGKEEKLKDWRSNNEGDFEEVTELLYRWAKQQNEEWLSTLGFRCEMDSSKDSGRNAPFQPIFSSLQVIPYHEEDPSRNSQFREDKHTGLMFCALIDAGLALTDSRGATGRQLMGSPMLKKTANSAWLHQGDLFLGSLIIDRRLWVEKMLLNQLEPLCKAVSLTCSPVTIQNVGEMNFLKLWLDDTKAPEGCAWVRDNETTYRWEFRSECPNNGVHKGYSDTGPQGVTFDQEWNITSLSSITMVLNSSADEIPLEITITYDCNYVIYTTDDNLRYQSWSSDIYTLRCTIRVAIKLAVSDSDQRLQPRVNRLSLSPIAIEISPADFQIAGSRASAELQKVIQERFLVAIDVVDQHLDSSFAKFGMFHYFGIGNYNYGFEEPCVMNDGHLFTSLKFCPT